MARAPKTKTAAAPAQREMPVNPPSRPSKELHVFDNPAPERDYLIQFQIPEFTCHCPLTGQPDFAHFTIDMVADKLCVELKSLKMYMWSFRDEGAFHEKVTNDILGKIGPPLSRAMPHHGALVCARRHLHQCGGRAPQKGFQGRQRGAHAQPAHRHRPALSGRG